LGQGHPSYPTTPEPGVEGVVEGGRRGYVVEHANSRLKGMLKGVTAMGIQSYTVQGILAALATLLAAHSAQLHGLVERVRCTKTLIQRRIMHHPL